MPNLVRRLNFPGHSGSPIDRPKLGKLTATTLSEGIDLSNQILTDSDVSITPLEVGLQTILTDRMLARAPAAMRSLIVDEHKRAWKEKLDIDLLGLFSGFSLGLSAAGSAFTVGGLGAGQARISGNAEPGPKPHFAVLHPYAAWDVRAGIIPLSSGNAAAGGIDSVSSEIIRNSTLGRLFSVPIWENGLISIDGSDDGYSAIFSKEAIMLFMVDEGSMRPQRDESARAIELNFVGEYGYGEWVDSYGYFFLNDLLAPTA